MVDRPIPGTIKIVKLCLYQSRQIRPPRPVLSRLAEAGEIASIKVLLDKGIGSSVRKTVCRSALTIAAHNGHAEVVRLLLTNGFDESDRHEATWEVLSTFNWREELKDVVRVLVQLGLSADGRENTVYHIILSPTRQLDPDLEKEMLLALGGGEA